MKIIRELLLLVVGVFILTSCNSILPGSQALNSQSPAPLKSSEVLSPFTQFENLEKGGEMGIDNEQVDNLLRSYGIYDKIMAKVPIQEYTGSNYSDVKIGDSRIHLSYSISFEYVYRGNSKEEGSFRFTSKYLPAVLEYWEYDLETQQLQFTSYCPALPQTFGAMKRSASSEYGILQGYIDFYRIRLGDKKVTTLGEWEKFMELK